MMFLSKRDAALYLYDTSYRLSLHLTSGIRLNTEQTGSGMARAKRIYSYPDTGLYNFIL